MTRKGRYNKQENPNPENKEAPSGRFVLEHNFNSLDKIADAIYNKKDADKEEKNQSHIISERQANEQARANRISLIVARVYRRANLIVFTGNIINALMCAATVAVFALNIKGIRAAKRSADFADSTFREVKKEFEFDNKPFIFFTDFKSDTMKVGKQIIYTVYYKNFGKIPAYIQTVKSGMTFSPFLALDSFPYELENIRPINIFCPNTITMNWPAKGQWVTKPMLEALVQLKLFFYVYGEIDYVDLVRKKHSAYVYCFRVFWDGRIAPTVNHNDIIEEIDSSQIAK